MTEVSFHFNVADRGGYACRLLRKAVRQGARVAVTGASASLARLDRELWSFDALEFLPHVLLRPGQQLAARLRTTPVWLVENAAQAEHHEVLLNEIVSADADDRAAARERWKHYATRGYEITRHEVAG